MPDKIEAEIAVIGSGPGGAVTACLFAEAGRQVLLVEEGAALDQTSCRPFSLDEMRQKYRNGGLTAALGPANIAYVEGRVAGGGSEVNSGLYHRTPPAVLEDWAGRFDLKDSSVRDMAPHFEACERELGVGPAPGPPSAPSLKLAEGARRLGLSSFETPRMFEYAPGGWTRRSMSKTYIPRALEAGASLLSRTRVRTLRKDGAGWTLRGESADRTPLLIAAQTVFLACGAIQTPAILRRSGIRHRVGDSLSVHPMLKVVAEFDETVNSPSLGVPPQQVKDAASGLSLGCSVSSPQNLAMVLLDHPAALADLGSSWSRMAAFYAMVSGSGRGTVRVLPGFSDPLVRYEVAQKDLAVLSTGLRRLAEALFHSGARRLYAGVKGLGRLDSPDDLARLPARLTAQSARLMTIHLLASCPGGDRRELTAADSFGKVHGHEGLYLADASLLGGPLGVNPQGSIMAFAHRNALKFLGRL